MRTPEQKAAHAARVRERRKLRDATETPEERAIRRAKEVERVRAWAKANPDKLQARNERRRGSEARKAQRKRWRANNPGYQVRYHNARYAADPTYALLHCVRTRLQAALRAQSVKKTHRYAKLLGCFAHELKAHIEGQFVEGMSWENRGEWHVDHIRPCATFDLSDPAQMTECFHYTNLRPLWAKDNMSRPKIKIPKRP
jgi:hypothetical protein